MKVIRTVIVDDEPLVLQMITDMLLAEEDLKIIGAYTNPQEALLHIQEKKPDLVFLDIDMPLLNGIELATDILNKVENIGIVFLTAYDQYAVEAFKLNAMHYILKPPSHKELKTAISRLKASEKVVLETYDSVFIRLLGGISICNENGASLVKWRTAKAEELFALLMITGDKGIDKWRIIDRLWPESHCSQKSEQLLYSTIYRVKTALNQAGIHATLNNKLGIYSLSLENTWCDVYELEKWDNRKFKDNGTIGTCDELFDIYRGELFCGRDYEWSIVYRSAMQKIAENLCDVCEEIYEKKGEIKKLEVLKEKRKAFIEI